MEKLSVISLFSDYTNFSKLLIHNFNNIQYPKELIEWIIVDDNSKDETFSVGISGDAWIIFKYCYS